ncbi:MULTISPECIES: DUF456 domain-containing protein [Carboxydocella]|uniref:DUF456 domain-containing protein n=2 Tax=Carboxydocella TaxID=178898 RepID=A0A1T4LW07_9FIRM|nr:MULTISPECIES: DUF456 domain-containing protein [Carboxydocella]AVX20644.1 hypothetical protein CFE_1455 [Carboxydocella thermautotrophica]AVX31066.1 hypothetical protein CTH_1476 [Carboxydocella thermautotrophica]SJZ58923.1 hypothetical protein SAMN02745885_00336 [Carboxydocella sporoproducens DSM 16521]GAW27966.1 hypothetical protein ULO1_05360 [Carboxydocella sp. ULO1]GAW32504.1 hypothetical protein JDF658_22690 [Carboxydocella sp. JDF658]
MVDYYWAYVLVMILGLLGTFLPVIPGIPLIFIAIFIYAWNTNFTVINIAWLLLFAALTVLSWLIEYFAGIIGSKQAGVSRYGMWGLLIGGILGFFWAPVGFLIGPVLGLLIGEILSGKELKQILITLKGAARGFIIGFLLKLIIALSMIGTFLWLT